VQAFLQITFFVDASNSQVKLLFAWTNPTKSKCTVFVICCSALAFKR